MRDDFRLAMIGGGRMGEALIAGLNASELLEPEQIAVAEIDPQRRAALAARFGVEAHEGAAEAVAGAHGVLLAVKPQHIDDVVRGLADAVPDGALVVSIAAGVSTERIEGLLGARELPVVRVMPNQAALAGKAVSAVSGGARASDADVATAVELMSAVGTVVVVPESLQNAVTAVSGSGPAYVYLFADALIQAGVRQGLSRTQASELVVGTLKGAAEMLARGGHPCELVDAVASPGGTTIAAIEALEMAGFRAALFAAVDAAAARASELG